MAREIKSIGKMQLQILKIIWSLDEATISDVHTRLMKKTPSCAYTTVATMMKKMEIKGLLSHRKVGRQFIYQPLVSRDDVQSGVANDVLDRLFLGNLAGMFSHLVKERDISSQELEELDSLIKKMKKSK